MYAFAVCGSICENNGVTVAVELNGSISSPPSASVKFFSIKLIHRDTSADGTDFIYLYSKSRSKCPRILLSGLPTLVVVDHEGDSVASIVS